MHTNLIFIDWCNIYQFTSILFWAISYNVGPSIVFVKSHLTSWSDAVWSFTKSWALVRPWGSMTSWLGWIAPSHSGGSIWPNRSAPIHQLGRSIQLQRALKRHIRLHPAPHWRRRRTQAIVPYSLPDFQYL